MAKGKKKEELSLEEKLEQALVSVEDQPYEVPENWCWVKLNSVSEMYTGNSINEKIKKEKYLYQPEGLNFIATKDIEFDNSIVYDNGVKINDYDKFKIAPENTSLLCIEGGSAGRKLGFTREKVCFGNKLCAFVSKGCVSKYIYYYLQSNVFYTQFANKRHGLIGGVSVKDIGDFFIPIATIEEQQRIVEQIEILFTKLDEAKEKVQDTLDDFEDRKAAILYKAFQGDLTIKWRENHTVKRAENYLQDIIDKGECFSRKEFKFWKNDNLPESWVESKIGNLLYFAGRIGWKGLKAEEYTEEGPLLLSVYNLNDGDEVSYNRVYHITNERYEESPEIMVEQDDVLLTKDGAGIGKLGYVKELPQKATINSSLLLIRPGNAAISKYIFYLLSGPELQRIVKERITGSATPHLFQRDIKEFIIPIPPLEEQEEIVQILDDVLSKEANTYKIIKNVVDQVDLIKKSILAKAFRGELGTNNPEEESAIELLKTLMAD